MYFSILVHENTNFYHKNTTDIRNNPLATVNNASISLPFFTFKHARLESGNLKVQVLVFNTPG